MNFAAIDCGTNSLHLLIARIDEQGRYDIVYDLKDNPRLGEGLTQTGVLSAKAQARALQTLVEYREICNRFAVERSRVVATSAVRRSLNQAEFARKVRDKAGFELDILSGQEEARLVALACGHEPGFTEGPYLLFNVGGGSTELVLGRGREIRDARSAEIGAVTATEAHLHTDPPKRGEVEAMEAAIARELKRTLKPKSVEAGQRMLFGSGGTVMNVIGVQQVLRYGSTLTGTFFGLSYKRLRETYLSMLEKKIAQRRTVAGLNPARADIIIGGIGIVKVLMETYGYPMLVSVDKGLKYGVVVEEASRIKQSLFLALLESQSRPLQEAEMPEVRHALKTRDLALAIFDAVAPSHALDVADRNLCALAAVLHDIGITAEVRKHHKRSYDLIRQSTLLKLPGRERDMVALIARYHRKAHPSVKHGAFAGLEKDDRRRVELLSGIVRLADGFDRSHSQAIELLRCHLSKGKLEIEPVSSRLSTLDCQGAMGKRDLFEKAFGLEVHVRSQWTDRS